MLLLERALGGAHASAQTDKERVVEVQEEEEEEEEVEERTWQASS